MSPLSSQTLEMQQSPSRWDYALECLVTLLLVAMPFAFGGRDELSPDATLTLTGAWSHEIFVALAGVMAALLAARQVFQRDARFVWTWAYLPIVLFLVLAGFQLVALPAGAVRSLSPQTVTAKYTLLGDLPNAPAILRSITLTFYPQATWLDLRKSLAVATVFVVVVNVYRRSFQIKRLLLTISIVGTAVALLALWQNVFGSRTIYGVVPMAHPNSGPFLNHSHFGQFMNLSIGAMLGLLLVKVGEITEGSDTFGDSFQLMRYAKLNGIYLLGFLAALGAATIFLSLTRGGVASLLVAATATAILYVWRRGHGGARTVLFVLALLVLLVVLYAAFGRVYERLATLRSAASDNGDRSQVLRDLSRAWRDYPLWGTGLGTHRYIFPMYDRSTVYSLAAYAENEYAQLMEETGAIGFAICLTFVVIIAASFVRCVWNPRRPVHLAAYGLGFGLLAILIHSATDFGQHDPANACLTATFAALLVALARHARPLAEVRRAPARAASARTRTGMALRVGALAAVVALFVTPLRDADAMRRARAQWAAASDVQAALVAKGWENGTNADYVALMRPAAAAVQLAPHDATMRYWLNDFRWQGINASRDPHTGALALSPGRLTAIARIVDDLNVARAACPSFGPVYALAGQLEYFLLHGPHGEALIRTGYRLDHNDPVSCCAMAQLDAAKGQWDDALRDARRAMALDRNGMSAEALGIFVSPGRPELAYELVRGDLDGLQMLARMLGSDPKNHALQAKCEAEATGLLLGRASAGAADAEGLARAAEVHAQRSEPLLAIDCYQRALAKNYANVDWRFRLAGLLERVGKYDEAAQQARACLRLRPSYADAEALLARVDGRHPPDR